MKYLFSLLVAMVMVTCADGHGRMIVPASRSAMWRYHYGAPVNTNDMGLDCGGQGVTWDGTNSERGRCGVCGDPYNARVRENEAGGKYATGIIAAQYSEGQVITVVLAITVSHGGWSEFRICPNNDVHRVVSQDCLDKHQLYTVGGKARFYHPVRTGNVNIQLVLPKGLTCSQCVIQWWWKTNANNNCRPATGKYCCIACGRQEIFVNCADVSIGTAKPAIPNTARPVVLTTARPAIPITARPVLPITARPGLPITVRPAIPITARPTQGPMAVPTTTHSPNNKLPENFLQINNTSTDTGIHGYTGITITSGFLPIDVGSPICAGTEFSRGIYGSHVADRWCQSQCRLGICPAILCNDVCRV